MAETMENTHYVRKPDGKSLVATRFLSAPVGEVWKAWTDPAIVDQWWAPKPWRTETKSMNFASGGAWLYAMAGPDGSRHWSKADLISVDPQKGFHARVYFCDEAGTLNPAFPVSEWHVTFQPEGNGTKATVEVSFKSADDLNKLVEMGFQQGFAMAHNNLDELLDQ